MHEIKITLTNERLAEVAKELHCLSSEVEKVLNAYFQNDISSKYYQSLYETTFDVNDFLASHQPAELMMMRATALQNKTTEKQQIEQKEAQTKLL